MTPKQLAAYPQAQRIFLQRLVASLPSIVQVDTYPQGYTLLVRLSAGKREALRSVPDTAISQGGQELEPYLRLLLADGADMAASPDSLTGAQFVEEYTNLTNRLRALNSRLPYAKAARETQGRVCAVIKRRLEALRRARVRFED